MRVVNRCGVLVPVWAMAVLLAWAPAALGETAYGVTANGTLFRFDTSSPQAVTTVGNLGIVPRALAYRPDTGTLYALTMDSEVTRLYTVSRDSAAVSPVGTGIPTSVPGSYNLAGGGLSVLGLDVDPRSLAADGGVALRVVSPGEDNVRLNSRTGALAGVDTPVNYVPPTTSNLIGIDAIAYTNSGTLSAGGPTTLYAIDVTSNTLLRIGGAGGTPAAGGGVLTAVGAGLGAGLDVAPGVGFDIVSRGSEPGDADDVGFAVFTTRTGGGAGYLLYDINLATGTATNGRPVGGGLDFSGGFAVVPEPAAAAALLPAVVLGLARRRSQRPR